MKRRRIQEGLPSEEALASEEAQTSHPVSDD